MMRIELMTFGLSDQRSNLLSYIPIQISPTGFEPATQALEEPCSKSIELRGRIAGHNGIEPISAESESAVLPLHQCPIATCLGFEPRNRLREMSVFKADAVPIEPTRHIKQSIVESNHCRSGQSAVY